MFKCKTGTVVSVDGHFKLKYELIFEYRIVRGLQRAAQERSGVANCNDRQPPPALTLSLMAETSPAEDGARCTAATAPGGRLDHALSPW